MEGVEAVRQKTAEAFLEPPCSLPTRTGAGAEDTSALHHSNCAGSSRAAPCTEGGGLAEYPTPLGNTFSRSLTCALLKGTGWGAAAGRWL